MEQPSCSSPTSTPKGNLTGVVHLEGQSNQSGIIVAIFELSYLDTIIVRINNEYPHIGVHINQHTEFDHRFQSPVKFTETDISDLIFDKNDVELPQQQYYGIVNYIPFLTQEYYNAGIQGE